MTSSGYNLQLHFYCKGGRPGRWSRCIICEVTVDFNGMKWPLPSTDPWNDNKQERILISELCPGYSLPAAIFAPRSLQVCSKRAAQLILQPKVMSNFAQVDNVSESEIDTSSFQTKPSSWKRLEFAKIIHNS